MASKYKIGYYYERKTKKILEENGWDVWRSPASQSPIDIIAIKPDKDKIKIKLIQIKRTSKEISNIEKTYKYDIEKMLDLAKRYKNYDNVDIELWIFKKDNKNPFILNIKNLI
ncbi:MAG: hypothetical protein QXR54_02425 [Nanopusillaceae archaeon]